MKAVVLHQYGDSSVLKLEEMPEPTIGPGDALARVKRR